MPSTPPETRKTKLGSVQYVCVDILPCPFCAHNTVEIKESRPLKRYWVQCNWHKCIAMGPLTLTALEALGTWNAAKR